ncbi:AC4 [Cotton leaf curl Alabad virus]|uniref:AC4 n=1 Tax=Cotton leaf curl Alabad virus TaxID=222456 RepID=C9W8K3_9GEMI|nr:AC4 [Cotton leaf curl Alabad virus]QCY72142.1 AC4 protein [Cotton leaf curl Alabad virus]
MGLCISTPSSSSKVKPSSETPDISMSLTLILHPIPSKLPGSYVQFRCQILHREGRCLHRLGSVSGRWKICYRRSTDSYCCCCRSPTMQVLKKQLWL